MNRHGNGEYPMREMATDKPTRDAKAEREEIERQTAEYLANGGKVKQVTLHPEDQLRCRPPIDRAASPYSRAWVTPPADMAAMGQYPQSRRNARRRQQQARQARMEYNGT